MKIRLIILTPALYLLLLAVFSLPAWGQKGACDASKQLLQTLRTYHVDPPADKNLYADRAFQQFLRQLDPQGLYLTQVELNALKPTFKELEDNLGKGNCLALQEAVKLYSRQYSFVDSLRHALLRQPFAFKVNDTLLLSITPKAKYAANRQELISRWEKQLAYSFLYEAYIEASEGAITLKNEALLRKKVQDRMICRRSRIMQSAGGLEGYVSERFLQALATAYDPHTNYMPPADKEQYLAALSTQTESFGIELDENQQGDIEIGRLLPGGPAWKSNELHEGDVLLSLRSKSGQVKEFSCTTLEEADMILADAAFKHAFLTVRKKSGLQSTVELVMEKLQVEENVVTSFMMNGGGKVGYISLPAFYTQMDGNRSQGAAHDVAKEIVQLKRAGMQGLILDLRYNGGGSVMEALNLAGIFIDEGPLGVELNKGEKPRLMKDMNRGVLFDGALIILVNGFSASASEILAQSLQEYNRALIVGSSTYGKATMQVVLPLSGQTAGRMQNPEEAFVKLTIGKYYGVKSSSYQKKGVSPDISLADGISVLGIRESAYPTALEADKVDKKVLYKPLAPLPVAPLLSKSQERLKADAAYAQQLDRVKVLANTATAGFPLRLSPQSFKEDYDKLLKLYEDGTSTQISGPASSFELMNLAITEELLGMNEKDREINDNLKQELQADVWLSESYRIMLDLLALQKRNN